MAQNFVSCEAFWNRAPSQPNYTGEWSSRFDSNIDFTANPIISSAIPFVPDQRPGAGWVTEVIGYLTTSDGTRAALGAISGVNGWFLDGVYTVNGAVDAIEAITTIGIGRQTTQYRLNFSGAARTAILALSGDPLSLSVEVRYRPERKFRGFFNGFSTFGEFVTVPPAAIPANQNADYINAPAFVDSMLLKFAQGGPRYNVAPVGATPVYANECSFAAVDVTGFVIVEPGDIGVGPGQIPAGVGDNTAERFRYHPNTFFRVSEDVKGVAVRRGDTISLPTLALNSQPIGIYVNEATLVDTRWLFQIDGETIIANFHLDSALTPKTPLQLYNQVIAPIIQGSEATARAVTINSSFKLDRLRYLHYARMLDRVGTETTQTGAAQG